MKKTEIETRNLIASKLKSAIKSLEEVSLEIPNLLDEVKDDIHKIDNINKQLYSMFDEHYSKEALSKLPKLYSVSVILKFIESEEKKRTGGYMVMGLKDNLISATNAHPGKDISETFLFQNMHHYKYITDNKIAQLKKRLDIFIKNLT
jgi:hypothetical protein